jgi:DnaJ domain
MTGNYLKNYLILGIHPGASWKQLRQAYKKMVNAWHPDRFQQDVRQKKLAEEKTKEITQAYNGEETASTNKNSTGTEAAQSPPPGKVPEPATVAPAAEIPKHRLSKQRARMMAAVTLLGSVYFIWQFTPWDRQDNAPANGEYGESASNLRHEAEPGEATPVEEKRFTVGSSLGEVYAIQGVPTKTEKDVWFYGNSKVYFAKGKVLRWDEKTDSPLRVDIASGFEKASARFFGRGSTKEDVLAAQGRPDRDAGSVWDYGLSRVYFENDRVTGWHEAQYNPLRVRN